MNEKIYDGDPAKFDHLIREGYEFKTREYISRGWEILSGSTGSYLGFILVAGVISGIANSIPYVGILVSIAIGGPIAVGTFIFSQKLANGEVARFEHFFDGFQDYVQLTLTYALYMILAFSPMFLTSLIIGYDFYAPDPSLIPVIMLVMIPSMYLILAYSFALPLVVFERMSAWNALELSRKIITKRWFSFFLFLIALSFIQVLGLLALVIGLLFTIPLYYTSMYAAYEDIIGGHVDPLLEKIDEIGQEIKPEEFDDKF
ncbi:MAG: hypothetical protein AAF388_27780 [Bacteroidota bacterium]